MRRIISISFVLLVFLGCTKEENPTLDQDSNVIEVNQDLSKSNWNQVTNFKLPVYMRCIGANENEIYAGTDENVYQSINNGIRWVKLDNKGLDGRGLREILVDNQDIWGGQALMGLYHSTDKGKSWTHVGNGIPRDEPIYSINKSNNNLYVGTYGKGLFRSTDNGGSFVNIFTTDSIGEPVCQIATQGSKIVIALFNHGIFYSDNNGDSWSDISLKNSINFSPWGLKISENNIFVTSKGKIYRKSISETDWLECNNNLPPFGELMGIEIQDGSIIVATAFGISYTIDKGNTWTNNYFSENLSENDMFRLVSNGTYVFSTDQYNVWRTKIE